LNSAPTLCKSTSRRGDVLRRGQWTPEVSEDYLARKQNVAMTAGLWPDRPTRDPSNRFDIEMV
jgi:hypothetical protein